MDKIMEQTAHHIIKNSQLWVQKFSILFFLGCILHGCYPINRMENLGSPPSATPIKDPTKLPHYHPVTMPMPEPKVQERRVNSLWQEGARGFFKDQRAKNIGDVLTVVVNVQNEQAEFSNESERSRDNSEELEVNSAMGYEKYLKKVLPEGYNLPNLVDINSNPSFKGKAKTKRSEKLAVKIAATITQILPNGNYVIWGRQETRVNFDAREITITGIVRPTDVTSTNTISYEKIAEARLIYGGRGHSMDFQQPPIGSQILGSLSPF